MPVLNPVTLSVTLSSNLSPTPQRRGMKRTQVTQGGRDDRSDGEEEEDPGVGFQQATPEVLSKRPMKGLPKRDGATNATSPTPINPPSTNRFAALSALGNSHPSAPSPFAKINGTHLPVTATAASQPPIINFKPTPLASAPTMANGDDDDKELTQLRGLNHSFMVDLGAKLKADPFMDLSRYFASYQKLRGVASSRSNTAASSTFSDAPAPANSFAWPEPKASAFPAPSSGGFKVNMSEASSSKSVFSLPSVPIPAETSKFTSFTPSAITNGITGSTATASKPANPPSIFKFGDSNLAADKSANTSQPPTPFKFTAGPQAANKTTLPFSFSPTSNAEPKPSGFSFSAPKPSAGESSGFTFPTAPSATVTSLFGSPVPAASFAKETTGTPTSGGNLPFGGSFGAFTPVKNASSKPIGFSFGSPLQDAKDKLPNSGSESSTVTGISPEPRLLNRTGALSPHIFPSLPSSLAVPLSEDPLSRDGTPFSEASGAGEEDDEVFPGEEDEITVYAVKCKVSKMKTENGKSEWSTMGVGKVKLKRDKDNTGSRILHRDTNSKRIIINCKIFKGLQISLTGRSLTFGAVEADAPVTYLMRVTTEEHAKALKTLIEEEVARYKSC